MEGVALFVKFCFSTNQTSLPTDGEGNHCVGVPKRLLKGRNYAINHDRVVRCDHRVRGTRREPQAPVELRQPGRAPADFRSHICNRFVLEPRFIEHRDSPRMGHMLIAKQL